MTQRIWEYLASEYDKVAPVGNFPWEDHAAQQRALALHDAIRIVWQCQTMGAE